MKNFIKPVLRMKTLSISSRSSSTQPNSGIFPYKLCQIKSAYIPAKVSPNTKSLTNSSLSISTVCKGLVFCPEASLTLPSMLKDLAILLFEPDKDLPGKESHEKILEEQQKQLEKLKNDPGKLRRDADDEKFPKYTPK